MGIRRGGARTKALMVVAAEYADRRIGRIRLRHVCYRAADEADVSAHETRNADSRSLPTMVLFRYDSHIPQAAAAGQALGATCLPA